MFRPVDGSGASRVNDPLLKFKDLNHDGKVSPQENSIFSKTYDTNKDGKVTPEEMLKKQDELLKKDVKPAFKALG